MIVSMQIAVIAIILFTGAYGDWYFTSIRKEVDDLIETERVFTRLFPKLDLVVIRNDYALRVFITTLITCLIFIITSIFLK